MMYQTAKKRRLRVLCLALLALLLCLCACACKPQGDVAVPGGDIVVDNSGRSDSGKDDGGKPDQGDARPDHGAKEDESMSGKEPTILPDLPLEEEE